MSLLNLTAAVRKAFPESLRDQAYADLIALDDRSLADIGLCRPQLFAGRYGPPHTIDTTPETPAAPQRHRAVAHEYFPPF